MNKTRILRGIISVLAGAVVAVGTSAVAATPAQAAPGDAQITNSAQSVGSLTVCQNYGQTGCASGIGTLYAGENTHSKFGWGDADGFFCVSTRRYLVGSVWKTCSASVWVKVSGGLIGRINVPIRVDYL
jgi:hypothetical protein